MNKNSLFSRGFTLIELLVVIAIIGILAAVVIGSLNDARQGGQDASIQQTMTNVRSQAELYYNGPGNYSYTGVCGPGTAVATGTIAALNVVNATSTQYQVGDLSDANADPTTETNRIASCQSNANSYAVVTPLADGASFWCIDSQGASKKLSSAPGAAGTSCP